MSAPLRPPAGEPGRDGSSRTLAFIADLAQSLAVTLDLRRTLSEAVSRIADFMQAEAASLFLFDHERRMLECRVCVGPVDFTGLRLAPGQGIVGRAVATGVAQVIADAPRDAAFWSAGDEDSGFVTETLLCAPLMTAAGPVGAIEIVNRRDGGAFTTADAEVLRAVAAPAALAIHGARMAHDLVAQQRLRHEFELARRLQRSLLPRRRKHGFPVLGVNRPAHEISGDFYDYFDLDDGRIGFVIGDVSGKGLDAALLMVRAASLLRWIGKAGLAPAEWLARVNAELCETARDGRFVCALVGYCDAGATHVSFAGAGFPPALLLRDGAFTDFLSGGPPLAIVADAQFPGNDVELRGGSLYACSDGATDVRDPAGRPIGIGGVRGLIERHAALAPDARLRALLTELKRLRFVDDTTLLLIEAPRAHADETLLARSFPAEPRQLRAVRADLRRCLDEVDVDPDLRDRLVLAVDEACTNVIRHAYAGVAPGTIRLAVTRSGDTLEFTLDDDAPTVDPACIRPRALGQCRPGGLGVALIDRVMDHWRMAPVDGARGNRLVMRKRIGEERPA